MPDDRDNKDKPFVFDRNRTRDDQFYQDVSDLIRGFVRLDESLKNTIQRLDETVRKLDHHESALDTKFEKWSRELREEFKQEYVTKDRYGPFEKIGWAVFSLIILGTLTFVGVAVTKPPVPVLTYQK